MTTQTTTQAPTLSFLLRRGGIAGVITAVLNAVVFGIGFLVDASFEVPTWPGSDEIMTVNVVLTIIFSILPAIAAALLLFGLYHFTARAVPIFYGIAAVILLLSFGPFVQGEVDSTTSLFLIVMRLVAAGVIVFTLTRQEGTPVGNDG